jgi:hypothetical protein
LGTEAPPSLALSLLHFERIHDHTFVGVRKRPLNGR